MPPINCSPTTTFPVNVAVASVAIRVGKSGLFVSFDSKIASIRDTSGTFNEISSS